MNGPCEGVLGAIGGTPLIRLRRLLPGTKVNIFAKLEALNPGGSIKDRPAAAILADALGSGELRPNSMVVESSSGNMGIGLAQACRFHGLRFLCIVDAKTTQANIAVMRAYGAEVEVVTEPDAESGELLQARLNRVRQILDGYGDGAFWPNQYANRHNAESHYQHTMREIAESLEGRVDVLLVATSTCGTMRGCGEFVREHGLRTQLMAVDAEGSRIFSDHQRPRCIPGLGAGIVPPLCDPSLVDRVLHVSGVDCVRGCRVLMEREAIFAGGSSGGVVAAAARLEGTLPAGANCVLVLPDRGERYLDTVYDDAWVREHLGEEALPAAGEPWQLADRRLMEGVV